MDKTVMHKLKNMDGEGGMIGVDGEGNFAMIFNSAGMYRGVKNDKGVNEVMIYG